MTSPRPSPHLVRRIAAAADADPRTIAKVLARGPSAVRTSVGVRIADAARALGVDVPSELPPPGIAPSELPPPNRAA